MSVYGGGDDDDGDVISPYTVCPGPPVLGVWADMYDSDDSDDDDNGDDDDSGDRVSEWLWAPQPTPSLASFSGVSVGSAARAAAVVYPAGATPDVVQWHYEFRRQQRLDALRRSGAATFREILERLFVCVTHVSLHDFCTDERLDSLSSRQLVRQTCIRNLINCSTSARPDVYALLHVSSVLGRLLTTLLPRINDADVAWLEAVRQYADDAVHSLRRYAERFAIALPPRADSAHLLFVESAIVIDCFWSVALGRIAISTPDVVLVLRHETQCRLRIALRCHRHRRCRRLWTTRSAATATAAAAATVVAIACLHTDSLTDGQFVPQSR
jgi:hypothetical protein